MNGLSYLKNQQIPLKVKYDKETDILYISLNDEPVAESDEDKPGIILDYSMSGALAGIELLNASQKCPNQMPLRWNWLDTTAF